jgi:hypothetical protein
MTRLFRLDRPTIARRSPALGGGRVDGWRDLMFGAAVIAVPAIAIVLIVSLEVSASSHTAIATLDAQAIIARDAVACQSPWQVIKGRDCHKLPAGTEVNVVSEDDFFACVVWSGTQRCMWIARDVLRKP